MTSCKCGFQPTSCSSKNVISRQIQHEREHGHSHHGHYHQHRHDQPQEDENCFIQEPYRNLLVHVRMFQMQYVFL